MKKISKILIICLSFLLSFTIIFKSVKEVNAQTIVSESDNIIYLPSHTFGANIGYDVTTTSFYLGWNYDSNGIVNLNVYVQNTVFNLTRYDFLFDGVGGTIVLPYFANNRLWTDNGSDISFSFLCTEEEFITYYESIDSLVFRTVAKSNIQYNFYNDEFSISSPLFSLYVDLSNNYNPISTRTYPTLNVTTFGGLSGKDFASAYEEGRGVGFEEGKLYAKDYYYNLGYQYGLNQNNPYTFYNLIGAVIDVPINAFKALLNFNLFDVNLLDFVLSILTFFLILKVVGWFSGRS